MASITITALIYWLQTSGLRIVIIVLGALLLRAVLNGALARLERSVPSPGEAGDGEKRVRTLASVLRSLGLVTIAVAAGLMILSELGADIAPLLAGAGILGLALGLGAQSLVRDLIGGLFILAEQQFHLGDVVKIGDITGTVERMTLRATYLRDLEGILHLIPNGEVRIVSNLTRGWSRALVDVTVPYDCDTGQVMELLQQVCAEAMQEPEVARVLSEAPMVTGVEGLDASGVRLRILAKTQPGQQWMVSRALRRRVKERLEAAGISAAYPRQVVYVQGRDTPE